MEKKIAPPHPQSFAFVFVCQAGPLEGMSLLLAASLKRFLKGKYELIAAIPFPSEKWGRPDPRTLEAFRQMGVKVTYFENPLPLDKKGNPLTNKIYSLQVSTSMDKLVFLDSDLLCLRDFNPSSHFPNSFSAAPTFLATGGDWESIYAAVNEPVPTERIPTLFSSELQPPYFNSGFIALDANIAAELTATWLDTFDRIEQAGAMEDNPYFREQVSLAVAVIRLKLSYDVLGQNYNYWVKFKPLNTAELPYFLHHTWPHPPIYHQPFLNQLVRSLVQDYPTIRPFVSRCRWKYYLRPGWMVDINRKAHKNRQQMESQWGKPLTQFMVHGHL
jgi:hypothetical protein